MPSTSTLHPGTSRPLRGLGGVLLALACLGATPAIETSPPVTIVPAPPADAAAAAPVKPPGSFLSAELPGEVVHQSGVRETVVGDIEHTSAITTVGDATLSITVSILPPFVRAMASDGILYGKARNELLKAYAARRTHWDGCAQAGLSGRELRYEASEGRKGMARFFLRDGVLVVLNAVYRKDAAVARRFLDSAR